MCELGCIVIKVFQYRHFYEKVREGNTRPEVIVVFFFQAEDGIRDSAS